MIFFKLFKKLHLSNFTTTTNNWTSATCPQCMFSVNSLFFHLSILCTHSNTNLAPPSCFLWNMQTNKKGLSTVLQLFDSISISFSFKLGSIRLCSWLVRRNLMSRNVEKGSTSETLFNVRFIIGVFTYLRPSFSGLSSGTNCTDILLSIFRACLILFVGSFEISQKKTCTLCTFKFLTKITNILLFTSK